VMAAAQFRGEPARRWRFGVTTVRSLVLFLAAVAVLVIVMYLSTLGKNGILPTCTGGPVGTSDANACK
jgi:hypothetical protein